MANLFLCHDDEGNEFFLDEEEYFDHSAKGTSWKKENHKYLYIDKNGNYVYDGNTVSAKRNTNGTKTYSDDSYTTNVVLKNPNNTQFTRSFKTAAGAVVKADSKKTGDIQGYNSGREYKVKYYDSDGNTRISAATVNFRAVKNRIKAGSAYLEDLLKKKLVYANAAYDVGKYDIKKAINDKINKIGLAIPSVSNTKDLYEYGQKILLPKYIKRYRSDRSPDDPAIRNL